tara:strand:- start:7703 stop:7975 length:273 start_codon:yes stop_codon:yes gene_type:complete
MFVNQMKRGNKMKITKYEILNTRKEGVHWGWWVFWLVFFWPMLIAVAWVHSNSKFEYEIVVRYTDNSTRQVWIDEAELTRVKLEVGGWDE